MSISSNQESHSQMIENTSSETISFTDTMSEDIELNMTSRRGPKQGVKRGPYKRQASKETRFRIIDAANRGEDWVEVSIANGVKPSTARTWLSKGSEIPKRRGNKKGRAHNTKVTQEIVDYLMNELSINPQLTLKTMAEGIFAQFNIRISPQTISNALDGQSFTVKKVHFQPDGMNTLTNKAKRKDFVEKIMTMSGEGKFIVYIDESNVNLYIRRNFGRSKKGLRSVAKLPNSKGPNIHMIAGISQQKLHHFKRLRGAFRHEAANEWLRGLLRELQTDGHAKENLVLISDNAPCHSRFEGVFQETEFLGITYLRMAPYSPALNPIEYAWNSIKSAIKNQMSSTHATGNPTAQRGVLTLTEFRLRRVENSIDMAYQKINMLSCLSYFNHVQKFYPTVLSLSDLPVGQ